MIVRLLRRRQVVKGGSCVLLRPCTTDASQPGRRDPKSRNGPILYADSADDRAFHHPTHHVTEGRAFVASNVHQCPSFHQRGFRLHGLHAKPDRCSRGLDRSNILRPAISNDAFLTWNSSPFPTPASVSWCSHEHLKFDKAM